MDMKIVKEALHTMLQRGDHEPNITSGIQDALEEIRNLEELWGDVATDWEQEVSLIPLGSIIDLVNLVHYDTYGLLRRSSTTVVDYSDFAYDVRGSLKSYGYEYIPDEALKAAFEFLCDLWEDNERTGHNNLDGSFRK